MGIDTITLTGVDEYTDLPALLELIANKPVEIGVLYSTEHSKNKYPSLTFIKKFVKAFGNKCSVHLCGNGAKNCVVPMCGTPDVDWLRMAGRIQVNGYVHELNMRQYLKLGIPVITQYPATHNLVGFKSDKHQLLVDSSGGHGRLAKEWHRPFITDKTVGFAGGLGPNNLRDELRKIEKVAYDGSWVDMETNVRNDRDRFELYLVEECIDIFLSYKFEEFKRNLDEQR